MSATSYSLGKLETKLLMSLLNREEYTAFHAREARQLLNARVEVVSGLLKRLEDKGIVRRIARGWYVKLYDGNLPPLVNIIASAFRDQKYYLGLGTAAHYWGLTTRLPYSYHIFAREKMKAKRLELYVNKLARELGGRMQLIMPNERLFFDIRNVVYEGVKVHVSSPEKLILDGLLFEEHAGGVYVVAGWLLTGTHENKLRPTQLSEDVHELEEVQGLVSAARRLGFLLEELGNIYRIKYEKGWLNLIKELKESFSYRLRGTSYLLSRERRGSFSSEWKLLVPADFRSVLRSQLAEVL